jgi:hypothetical protein
MKRELRLTVQLEGPPAYAGRHERQAPAPRLRPLETPCFHVARFEGEPPGGGRRSGEQKITKYRQPLRKIFYGD